MKHLIIGVNSEAGKTAMKAIRETDPNAYIVGTTSKDGIIEACDATVPIADFTNDNFAGTIIAAVRGEEFENVVYCPAFGTVGVPVDLVSKEEIEEAKKYSYYPILRIREEINHNLLTCFSSLYWFPFCEVGYGAMYEAKKAIEDLAQKEDNIAVARIGLYQSKSLQGISLLVRRAINKKLYPNHELLNKLTQEYKDSGMSWNDNLNTQNNIQEAKYIAEQLGIVNVNNERTNQDHILKGLKQIFTEFDQKNPITNIVGQYVWNPK